MLNADWIIPQWPAPASVKACVTTRTRGTRTTGASITPYDAFNLALHVDDDTHQVEQNRMALQRVLGLAKQPAWLNQVHSNDVVSWQQAMHRLHSVDACYSFETQQACVVMTADCLPILLTNRYGTVVAAAHAGWRGLVNGVIANTIKAMNCRAEQVMVWLGPAISAKNYEVDNTVYDAFVEQFGEEAKACFCFTRDTTISQHYLCDLYALAKLHLLQQGVSQYRIYGAGIDQEQTFCTYDDSRFYSYRQQKTTGRFASLIWME